MSNKRVFQGITIRTKKLLSSGEDINVDYKEKVNGLHVEDFVAFANSENGGTILIGVREGTDSKGAQIGEPIGHTIDDKTKLQIIGKALSCSPPIQIELFVENYANQPFYRIEIPSGLHKPHSTSNGTYKIREDGRNNPLLPELLLKMFIKSESEEFSNRFSEAANELESRLIETLERVDNLEQVISTEIEDIGNTLGWAEFKASDAADTIDTVKSQVSLIELENNKLTQRIIAIATKVGADDPVKKNAEKEILGLFVDELTSKPDIVSAYKQGKQVSVSLPGNLSEEINQDDLRRLLHDALKDIKDK